MGGFGDKPKNELPQWQLMAEAVEEVLGSPIIALVPLAASSRAGNHSNSSRAKDFFNSLGYERHWSEGVHNRESTPITGSFVAAPITFP
jgi:hypothetical protein